VHFATVNRLLDLDPERHADNGTEHHGPSEPAVVKVELVWELHYLGPRGVRVTHHTTGSHGLAGELTVDPRNLKNPALTDPLPFYGLPN